MKTQYYVTTWDTDLQAFTPQAGVRTGPYSLFGLRKALRKLREYGYSADRDDPSVLVTSTHSSFMKGATRESIKRPRKLLPGRAL